MRINKNRFIKLCIITILVIPSIIVFSKGTSYIFKYMQLRKELVKISEKLQSPFNTESEYIKSGNVHKVLSNLPKGNNIDLLIKIDDTDTMLKTQGAVSLDSIKTLDENIILEAFISTPDMGTLLKYLNDNRLIYDSIDIEDGIVSFKIYVRKE